MRSMRMFHAAHLLKMLRKKTCVKAGPGLPSTSWFHVFSSMVVIEVAPRPGGIGTTFLDVNIAAEFDIVH